MMKLKKKYVFLSLAYVIYVGVIIAVVSYKPSPTVEIEKKQEVTKRCKKTCSGNQS